MINFFLHGPLMDEAGDTGGGGALIDSWPVDTGSESTALTVAEPTEIATTDEPEGAEGTDLATIEDQPLTERGKPSRTTSEALKGLMKTHPNLAKQIPRDMAVANRLRSMFPGQNPFEAVNAALKRIKLLGGESGIQDIQKELRDIQELDDLYAKSDPRMLDRMTDTPEGKAAFQKLAVHVINKLAELPGSENAVMELAPKAWDMYSQVAPKGWSKYIATTVLADMLEKGLEEHLIRVSSLIPADNEVGVAALKGVQGYLDHLKALRAQSAEVPTRVTPTKDPRDDEYRQREENLAKKEREAELGTWKKSADGDMNSIFQTEWAKQTKGRKISAVDGEDIRARIALRVPKALAATAGYEDQRKSYVEATDKTGYLTYMRSLAAKHIPLVVAAELRRKYGAPAVTMAKADTPAAAATTARTPPAQGFKRVAVKPEYNTIHRGLGGTTAEMFNKKMAVLKDGTKVSWA